MLTFINNIKSLIKNIYCKQREKTIVYFFCRVYSVQCTVYKLYKYNNSYCCLANTRQTLYCCVNKLTRLRTGVFNVQCSMFNVQWSGFLIIVCFISTNIFFFIFLFFLVPRFTFFSFPFPSHPVSHLFPSDPSL